MRRLLIQSLWNTLLRPWGVLSTQPPLKAHYPCTWGWPIPFKIILISREFLSSRNPEMWIQLATNGPSKMRLKGANGTHSVKEQEYLLQEMPLSSNGDIRSDQKDACLKKSYPWMNKCRKNWKNILVVAILWMAYFFCRAALSTIAPFFPQIVSACSYTLLEDSITGLSQGLAPSQLQMLSQWPPAP